MKHILTIVTAGFFAVPVVALGQGVNTDALRPPAVPTATEVVQPLQNAFEVVRPANLEAVRAAKEGILQNIKNHRERLKNATVLERPLIRADLTQTRQEMLRLVDERRQFVTDILQEKRASAQGTSTLRRLEALDNYVARFGEVLEGRIERLIAIADRAEERIARLEEERGVDLSDATALLDEAYGLLEVASRKAEEFSGKVSDAIEGEGAQAAAAEMKILREEVQTAIRAAHQKLVEAIAAVRAGLSTTPTTN